MAKALKIATGQRKVFKTLGIPSHQADLLGSEVNYDYVVNFDEVEAVSRQNESANPDYNLTVPAGVMGHAQQFGTFSMRIAGQARLEKWVKETLRDKLGELREVLVDGAREIHQKAVEYAPYETGQLRRDSRAAVGGRTVSRGTDQEEAAITPVSFPAGRMKSGDSLTMTVQFWDEPRVKTDRMGRTRTSDFLVSVWTHENLGYNPKQQGTGPKYLEKAYQETIDNIERRIKDLMRFKF